MSKKTKTAILEGNICCGKSTLCTVTTKKFGPQFADATMEAVNHTLLTAFYQNPKQYAFAMQWGQLKHRLAVAEIARVRKTQVTVPSPEYMLIDRGLAGDQCFAIWNMLTGNINSHIEFAAYYEEMGASKGYSEFIASNIMSNHADFLIFIDAEPSLCRARAIGERNDDAERNIKFDYFRGIDSVHFCMMRDLTIAGRVPVHIYTTPGTNDAAAFKDFLTAVSAGKRRPAHIDTQSPSAGNKLQTVLLYDRGSVQVAYAKRTDKLLPDGPMDVFFDTANCVDLEAMKQLHNSDWFPEIKMYYNAFIRMVYIHLRRGDRVHLYMSKQPSSSSVD